VSLRAHDKQLNKEIFFLKLVHLTLKKSNDCIFQWNNSTLRFFKHDPKKKHGFAAQL
jgi:hypothetical protein